MHFSFVRFPSGCEDPPSCMFVFALTQYFPSCSHLPSVFCLHFSPRLPVRTCVHQHQHILATCYLITRARPTLRTSLAEHTWAKKQSACYATKANHTTRTVATRGVWRTDTKSNRGTFYIENGVKQTNQIRQNVVKVLSSETGGEDIPNTKISVNFPENISCSALNFYLCFLLGILPQRTLMEKPCQHRPLFQKTKKEVLKKGTREMYSYLTIDSRSEKESPTPPTPPPQTPACWWDKYSFCLLHCTCSTIRNCCSAPWNQQLCHLYDFRSYHVNACLY